MTLFPQELAWHDKVDLGSGIESLWTGTACVSDQPGRVHGVPLRYCTREQFIDEIEEQVLRSKGLQSLIKQANNSRSIRDFNLKVIEVWDEWQFSHDGISSPQPKWVTTTNTK